MTPEFMRIFVAVKLEEEKIVDRIINLQEDLAKAGLRAKFVEPENLHFTLKFIGEVPPETVEKVRRVLSEVSGTPFTLEMRGVGGFPSLSRPRVIWIGVRQGDSMLIELSSSIEKILSEKAGIKRSSKEFHPHLTIARVKGFVPAAARKLLEEHKDTVFGDIRVDRFLLMRSRLTPRGPIYTVIESYALQ